MDEQSEWEPFLSGKLGLAGLVYSAILTAALLSLFLVYGSPWESKHDAEMRAREFDAEIKALTATQATTQKQLNELAVSEARFEEHVIEIQRELDRLGTTKNR